jgi:VCBS repeat protein
MFGSVERLMVASEGSSHTSTTRAVGRLAGVLVPLLLVLVCTAAPGLAIPLPVTIVTGQSAGWPDVRGFDRLGDPASQLAPWGTNPVAFSAYPTYQNGVRVAVGDVNGDGRMEIVTAPGKGAWTELRVFDGKSFEQLGALLPFTHASWWNGAFVAAGDTNGDGRAEIVDGLDAGCCTTVHVVDVSSGAELGGFFPYGNSAETGARVAAADLNGDGKAEIFAVPLGSGRVTGFGPGGGDPFRTYQTFGDEAIGGVSIATGDVAGNPRPELIAAASTPGGVQVKVIDTQTGATLASLHPYGAPAVSTPEVAVGDIDGDGRGDIVLLAQLADGTQLRALAADGRQLGGFFVLEPGIVPGASLAAGDLDGDRKAEIILGGGPTTTAPWPPIANGPDQRVAVYRLDGTPVGGFTAYPGLFQGGVRVALADVERNGRPAMITAPGPGMEPEVEMFSQRWLETRDRGTRIGHFLAYEPSFTGGVSVAAGYWSGNPDVVVAPGPGRAPDIHIFDAKGRLISSFLAFEIVYTGGLSVAVGDLNADGEPEIVVGTLAAPARIRAYEIDGTPYGSLIAPFPDDGQGVQVGVADITGTGRGVILAAEADGSDPRLEVIDPAKTTIVQVARPVPTAGDGIRLGSGDLDRDGRDEILVAAGWGGDGLVRVLGPDLRQKALLGVYTWIGGGMNVAVAPRIGLPLRADALTVRLVARTRSRVVVGRFHDASRAPASAFRATIDWGDGTHARGVVLRKGPGEYLVRGAKRYATGGRYDITVTLADSHRASIAQSKAIVRAPR